MEPMDAIGYDEIEDALYLTEVDRICLRNGHPVKVVTVHGDNVMVVPKRENND